MSRIQLELLWSQNLLLRLIFIFVCLDDFTCLWILLPLTGLDQEMLMSQVLLIITMPAKIFGQLFVLFVFDRY